MTRKMRANKDLVGEWVPIGDLTPWDRNPRDNDHAVQSVADSIQRFGWGSVIVRGSLMESSLQAIRG